MSEQNFKQNKRFLRALPAGRIIHFTSRIYPSLVNRNPAIYVISRVGGNNGKIKIISSFTAIKLYFVITVLNNKTIIQELANSAYGLVDIPRDIPRDIPCSKDND